MPAAPEKQLVKVGFTPRQAAVLQNEDLSLVEIKDLVRAGFSPRQAKVLRSNPNFEALVRQAKFTRHQAKLFLGT